MLTLDVRTPAGARRRVTIEAVDADVFADWVGGWELLLPPRPGLAFLRASNRPWAVRYLPDRRTVLVWYDVVQEGSGGLVARIRRLVASSSVDRIVVDVRSNGGGEAGGYRALLRYLEGADPSIRILIGRLTFSAAASFVTGVVRRIPDATLLGEAMGGATSFWANPSAVRLLSGLVVLIPADPIGAPSGDGGSHRILPDVAVPFTARDYAAGRDPVLARALR